MKSNGDADTSDLNCRVCGYLLNDPPWGEDGCSPTWSLCPCCGTEFGYEDATPASIKRKRIDWISGGAKWFEPRLMPVGWSFEIQSLGIPEKFR
ncbi:hypothetical protein [Comamonas sp. MYb396]|jgi:hypothetical protein|uniref:hypothetical protein n=1 Tax=Comamonas sp. MYb396 TaxID=2745302 RepID=UPI00309B7699